MATLQHESLGASAPIEAEDKPRIRVRLHFGGTFAQDGPRQWRYVGGEVYNESFPMDSKYAEVSKRLNDKFGDTVSFKYLCPGDDIDPDNLVQVQGDDDLREMCDEYQNALQKPSTPVKTVRIKVFVFRAVIFEREVQELEEDLDDEEGLLDLPDDVGADDPVSSCDHEECGPNWSDWGEPDEHEVTESSLPSAHLSSDAELHTGANAAKAAAAATVALQNISMSVNSFASSKATTNLSPKAQRATGLAGPGGTQVVQVAGQDRLSQPAGMQAAPADWGAQGVAAGGSAVGDGCSSSSAVPASAVAAGTGGSCKLLTGGNRSRDSDCGNVGVPATQGRGGAAQLVPAGCDPGFGGTLGPSALEGGKLEAEVEAADYQGASYEGLDGAAEEVEVVAAYEEDELGYGDGCFADYEQQRQSGNEAVALEEGAEALGVVGPQAGGPLQRPLPGGGEWLRRDWEGLQTKWRGPTQEDWQNCERVWELEQQEQESYQIQRGQQQRGVTDRQQEQERQNLTIRDKRGLLESGMGFYCDEELEDPYGDPYDEDSPSIGDAALYAEVRSSGGSRNNRSSAASDGALRVMPRAADVAAYGGHLHDQYGNFTASGGAAAASTSGLLGRFPAAADLLPRHISAFGESSRDDSHGGGVGGGSGPFLPSRITIFGDDGGDSYNGTSIGAAGCGSTSGARAVAGGLHRLALLGVGADAGGAPSWSTPAAVGAGVVAGKPGGGDTTRGGDVAVAVAAGGGYLAATDGLTAGDSRQCITQEFGTQQQSSLLEGGGLHGSSGNGSPEGGCGGGGAGRVLPLDPLDPLMRTGLGGAGGALLGMDGMDALSPASVHNHPLKGVVKKRKSEVSILAKIGEGAFGEVSQAQVFPYGIVAIKWLKRERFAKYSESFQREAETLAKLNHPNIIRMYGLVMDTPDAPGPGVSGGGGVVAAPQGGGGAGVSGDSGGGGPGGGGAGGASGCGTPTGLIGGIITEFVRNGSLGQYLRSLNGRRLSLRQRAMIALQAALGMAYLHEQSPAVVHFDLKPDNLLVDGEGDSMVIKVADFGLSKHKLSNYVSCRDLRGTLPYMAYELVSSNGNISEKVDVYSMGVVMWEMYTGEVPFAHLTAQEILTGLLHGNLHLAIPPACEPEWRSLVETCMDPNPANRPSFQELAMQLQEILRLERQASNASSVSAATAAAAAAAVLHSSVTEPDSGVAGYGAAAGGAAAGCGGGGAAAGVGGLGGQQVGGALGAAAQWRMAPAPAPGLPLVGVATAAPAQGQGRSPAAPAAAALPQPPMHRPQLLAVSPTPPSPPQQTPQQTPKPSPPQQLLPAPQPTHVPALAQQLPAYPLQQGPYGNFPPYGIASPQLPAHKQHLQPDPLHQAIKRTPVAVTNPLQVQQQVQQQNQQHYNQHHEHQHIQQQLRQQFPGQPPAQQPHKPPPQQLPLPPHAQPPPQPQQHLQHHPQQPPKLATPFLEHLAPVLVMHPQQPVPPANLPAPHFLLPLRQPGLFPPPPQASQPAQQQHRLNGLYGLGTGVAPLVSWGERGM